MIKHNFYKFFYKNEIRFNHYIFRIFFLSFIISKNYQLNIRNLPFFHIQLKNKYELFLKILLQRNILNPYRNIHQIYGFNYYRHYLIHELSILFQYRIYKLCYICLLLQYIMVKILIYQKTRIKH